METLKTNFYAASFYFFYRNRCDRPYVIVVRIGNVGTHSESRACTLKKKGISTRTDCGLCALYGCCNDCSGFILHSRHFYSTGVASPIERLIFHNFKQARVADRITYSTYCLNDTILSAEMSQDREVAHSDHQAFFYTYRTVKTVNLRTKVLR